MKKKNVFLAACALTCVGGLSACGNNDNGDSNDGRVWGSGTSGTANGSQSQARFNNPVNVEVAADNGTVYVADFDNDAIRAIAPNGTVSTLASDATVAAVFQRPFGMTITPNGTLYVQTDRNSTGGTAEDAGTIWEIHRTTGVATVIAENVGRPRGLQAINNTTLAMSDPANHVVTLLNTTTGAEAPLAGLQDNAGDANGTGSAARFENPYGLDVLSNGNLLVADYGNNLIRLVTPAGVVTTFAGTGAEGRNNGPIGSATFDHPQDIAIDETGVDPVIFVADHDNFRIRRIASGNVSTFAGSGTQGFAQGTGTSASFHGLEGIALEADGDVLWIADGTSGLDNPTVPPYHRVRFLETP